jgi:ABC-type transport system substrate-binding protein
MLEKAISLQSAVATSIMYIGFNMKDPVVGSSKPEAKYLRQAISIAVDYEEYISIFANGRGVAAQGPIPPGIFGHLSGEQGLNHTVYEWTGSQAHRKSLDDAKQLLSMAGYPNGRHKETGEPLVLYFDVPASGPDSKAQFDWLRKQFQKLNIQLVVRNTDYNRFQDKMRNGTAQLFQWGWNADYPDPENFLFLLYGPNAKSEFGGENAANYQNTQFDSLYEAMRSLPNNKQRQNVIDEMLLLVRDEAPWIWGYHPKSISLYHSWNHNVKPNMMANNTLKYRRVDVAKRSELRLRWNRPVFWPILAVMSLVILALLPAIHVYRQKKRARIQT